MLKSYRKICKILINRKTIASVIVMAILAGMIAVINPNQANAVCGSTGIPSDTLTIKVGYYGGPYYTKKVYTLSDFDKLPQIQQAYTYIDNMGAICIDSAQGVKLAALMEDAGIDINSIQKFYFYTNDIEKGWYQCLDKSELLDTTRYYYPNLPSKWDYETQIAPPEALADAKVVDTIVSYKDNWQRYADVPDFSVYDTSTRFRLLFGQNGTTQHDAALSAKWIHSIDVMLGGMPPASIALDQTNIDLKVGSTVQLTATIAPFDATEKSVNWSSSDTNVATVDENGLVTVVGEGTAEITVSTVVGNLAAACIVNGPKKEENPNAMAGSNNDTQKKPPADNIKKDNSAQNQKKSPAKKEIIKAQNLKTEKSVPDEQSGEQPWRVYEMSPDAVPLQKQRTNAVSGICLMIIFLALFTVGASRKYFGYLQEIK